MEEIEYMIYNSLIHGICEADILYTPDEFEGYQIFEEFGHNIANADIINLNHNI